MVLIHLNIDQLAFSKNWCSGCRRKVSSFWGDENMAALYLNQQPKQSQLEEKKRSSATCCGVTASVKTLRKGFFNLVASDKLLIEVKAQHDLLKYQYYGLKEGLEKMAVLILARQTNIQHCFCIKIFRQLDAVGPVLKCVKDSCYAATRTRCPAFF